MTEKNSQMIETVQSVDSYKLWEESASGGDQTTAAVIDAETASFTYFHLHFSHWICSLFKSPPL